MYTLLRGFCALLSQKDEYSILILGLDGAGKSTFLEQAKTKFVKNYKPFPLNRITTTVGLNIGHITIGSVRLKFWDLGGQEELQSLWDRYYSESHGIIFIVDSADASRFDESQVAFDKVIRNPLLKTVPLLLLANKQDLEAASSVSEVNVNFRESLQFVGERECTIRGGSALNGCGIHDGIRWMLDKVTQNSHIRPPSNSDDN